jgi:glutathione S-transferase
MSQPALRLCIGNKNYSSWSMRPWVLMTQLALPFEEVNWRFDSFEPDSVFKQTALALNPVGKVPVLVDTQASGDAGQGLVVWDSLAMVEYLAERFPAAPVWPRDAARRARARSLCAEMHSGFGALRQHCPMNIEADLPEVGALIWRDQVAVRADVARIDAAWCEALSESGGPMLMGEFSALDAFFAPVVMRLQTYHLPVSKTAEAYMQRVLALSSVQAWGQAARAEADFLDFEEPYRTRR